MGTWSHEPFGNDSACDWAYDLVRSKDFTGVENAVQGVLDEGAGYLDADIAVESVAAAEVLAKALGRGTQTDAYTEQVDAWVASITTRPSPDLIARARAALARILGADSELRELWEESDAFDAWESSIKALQSALDS